MKEDSYSAMIREVKQRQYQFRPLNRKLSWWDTHHELIGALCVIVSIILFVMIIAVVTQ